MAGKMVRIRIITGGVNSGKSAKFLRLWREAGARLVNQPAGLYSEKIQGADGATIGYNLALLPSWEILPFAFPRETILPETAGDYYFQGKFAFLQKTFQMAERHILRALEPSADGSVWIDEIGNLELKGFGFDALLSAVFKSNREITFTVRSSLLGNVVAKYGIMACELL